MAGPPRRHPGLQTPWSVPPDPPGSQPPPPASKPPQLEVPASSSRLPSPRRRGHRPMPAPAPPPSCLRRAARHLPSLSRGPEVMRTEEPHSWARAQGPEGRLTFPATGQQLREHEQSAQCARHRQPFLPRRARAHSPSLASLEQTYLLWPPPRASPRSRGPGASVPPPGPGEGTPALAVSPARPPALQTPGLSGPRQGGSGLPLGWPPGLPLGARGHPQAAGQLLSRSTWGAGPPRQPPLSPPLPRLGAHPGEVRSLRWNPPQALLGGQGWRPRPHPLLPLLLGLPCASALPGGIPSPGVGLFRVLGLHQHRGPPKCQAFPAPVPAHLSSKAPTPMASAVFCQQGCRPWLWGPGGSEPSRAAGRSPLGAPAEPHTGRQAPSQCWRLEATVAGVAGPAPPKASVPSAQRQGVSPGSTVLSPGPDRAAPPCVSAPWPPLTPRCLR